MFAELAKLLPDISKTIKDGFVASIKSNKK